MWILCQDKKELVNISNTKSIYIEKIDKTSKYEFDIGNNEYFISTDFSYLGMYKSEKRAKSIMNDICNYIVGVHKLNIMMPKLEKADYSIINEDAIHDLYGRYIFIMPKE